jgi:hypothetical protein
MHPRLAIPALALLAAFGVQAQTKFLCPIGTTAVTTGSYGTPSCVGSSIQGMVESTLPFTESSLFGISPGAERSTNPIFTQKERPSVGDQPTLPKALGAYASTTTFASSREMADPLVPNKLAADWTYLYDGAHLPKLARQAWMGGSISRDMDGSLRFETSYGGDRFNGPIDDFRNDPRLFMFHVGPATSRLMAQRYGIDPSLKSREQSANARNWDAIVSARSQPGSAVLVGNPRGPFATVAFGEAGYASHVYDMRGNALTVDEFILSTDFSALTGRGIALRPVGK